eukprot:6210665-Pleurochrysis_carterae.AAC.9
MAMEHSLAVRIIEERCECHRKPCIKGYVDLGCFFMSVNREVQWKIEEAMGIPETIISNESAKRGKREGPGRPGREIRDSIRHHGTSGDSKGTRTGGFAKPGEVEADTSSHTKKPCNAWYQESNST